MTTMKMKTAEAFQEGKRAPRGRRKPTWRPGRAAWLLAGSLCVPACNREAPAPAPAAGGDAGVGSTSPARALRDAALELYRAGNREAGDARATAALREYARLGSTGADIDALHYETVVSLVEKGSLVEAETEIRRWLAGHPASALHHNTLAKLLFRGARHGEAARELEAALATQPGDVPTLRRLVEARAYEGSRSALTAVDQLLQAAGLAPLPEGDSPARPGEAECLAAAARALSRFGEHERAAPLWERLARLRSGDTGARLELGLCQVALGQVEKALATLEPLHSDPRHAAEALEASAGALAHAGRHGEAVQLLAAALEREPRRASAYHRLASALRRLGQDSGAQTAEEAARELQAAARERTRISEERAAGRPANALQAEVRALSAEGRFAEADAALSRPELRGQRWAEVLRAQSYLDWLRVAEARELLEQLARNDGGDASTISSLLERARRQLEDLPAEAVARDATLPLRLEIARTPWPAASSKLAALAGAVAPTAPDEARLAARLACAADPRNVEAFRALGRYLDRPAEVFARLAAWKSVLELRAGDEEASREVRNARDHIAGLLGRTAGAESNTEARGR